MEGYNKSIKFCNIYIQNFNKILTNARVNYVQLGFDLQASNTTDHGYSKFRDSLLQLFVSETNFLKTLNYGKLNFLTMALTFLILVSKSY